MPDPTTTNSDADRASEQAAPQEPSPPAPGGFDPSAWTSVEPLATGHDSAEDDHTADPPLVGADGAEDEAPGELVFASLPEFVEEFLAPMFGRDLDATRLHWCPQWWRHPEAVYRLESLWRSWEHLRQDAGLGSSTWIAQHLDHHWPRLTGDTGPLVACTASGQHREGRDQPLPVDPAPEGFMGVIEDYEP